MRIVHAIARLNVGGAALQVLELAAGQARRGHEVLVLHGRIPPGEESMAYVADERGVPTRYVDSLRRELSPFRDLAALLAVRAVLRERRPDVLHTHAAKAGAIGRLAALAAGSARPPVRVHTFHGHVLRGYFGARRERAFTLVERALARTTSALVAVSPEVRDDLVALGVASVERFTVVPYGFDFPAPSRNTERQDGFVVGYAGRLTAIKRPLDLVRVLRRVVDRGTDASLLVVGDGEEREAVERAAAELGVGDRCVFAGYQRDMAEWYGRFDAFCLTSANEGTPVAAIEALAAGVPVVATRVGGTPAVVDDGETGFLAEPGDVDALAEHVVRLARDLELRERMGRTGAERMRARYGIERMVDEVQALYERLLGR
ncbi:MAG: glycosyltransferase family 4 protein [Gaiellaceae bacterium]